MLSRKLRLSNQTDITSLKNSKNQSSNSLLSIKRSPNRLTHNRVGIIVSKKVARNAADRNKLKRRLSHIVFNWVKTNHPPTDLLLFPKKSTLKTDYKNLEDKTLSLIEGLK